ncbi:MAG: hypothetical protein IJ521_13250 [Schwartzia sp.]|nr:hypothetical protein [Schwartzia sp. (in: firmicutes)]
MQKMKNGLMMFCLTVLLSCTALMMNTPTASAMTLADLQGDYRIVSSESSNKSTTGSVISIQMENGELIARVKKPSSGVDWNPGDVFMKDVYVDRGTIYCKALVMSSSYSDLVMVVSSNGSTLELYHGKPSSINGMYELHRM